MSEVPCTHCHTPFTPTEREPEFCCSGCRFVNRLLLGEGLGDFYKLQGGKAGRPVGDRPFEEPQTAWLQSLIAQHERADQTQHTLRLRISGVTCLGCVWLIERLFTKEPGAGRIEINAQTGQVRLSWRPGAEPPFAADAFAVTLQRFNYLLGPAGTGVAVPPIG